MPSSSHTGQPYTLEPYTLEPYTLAPSTFDTDDNFICRSGRDLVNMAKQRPNVIPIIEDARHPQKYRMLVPMVDVVFADVAQPDQARIVGLNAQYFLKNGGNFVISIKASCIDSTAPPEAVFAREVKKMAEFQMKPKEQVTLEPYERDHAMVVGVYRPAPKKKD